MTISPSSSSPNLRTKRRRVPIAWVLVGLTASAIAIHFGWDWHRAHRVWRAAEESLGGRDYAAASHHLSRYRQLRPGDPAGWFLSARTARRLGRYAEAEQHIEQFQRLGEESESSRLERDLLDIQQGKIGDLDARLRATIEPDHPDAPIVLEALARGYIASDRWADARQASELWRAVQPDHPWAWWCSGLVAERQGQLEQAAEFYRRGMDVAPDDRDSRAAFARVLVRRRQPAPALEQYEWLLARQPNDLEALLGLAACRIELGQANDAVPLLDRVLARDPLSFSGLYLRGKAALEQRDPTLAENCLRKAVRVEPGNPEALHALAQALRDLGKKSEATELDRQHDELQRDLRRLGELMRTIAPLLEDGAPCREAGIIALRIGRTRQGVNLLHDALRRKGDHRPTHAALAEYYRRVGSTDRADFHQRLADQP